MPSIVLEKMDGTDKTLLDHQTEKLIEAIKTDVNVGTQILETPDYIKYQKDPLFSAKNTVSKI